MADISVTYKDAVIAEIDNGRYTKTLKTKGCYCEDDITIDYAPRSKTYEITLAKASGWVLLTTLDAEVLEHINDSSLAVSLVKISEFSSAETYTVTFAFVTNNQIGIVNTYPVYGLADRQVNATTFSQGAVFYPPNNTSTSVSLGGSGQFRLSGSSYYFRPADIYIQSGTYRLTFNW